MAYKTCSTQNNVITQQTISKMGKCTRTYGNPNDYLGKLVVPGTEIHYSKNRNKKQLLIQS